MLRVLVERWQQCEAKVYQPEPSLAGCDRLTISPDLLEKLAVDEGKLQRKLSPGHAGDARVDLTEAQFRWESNEDAMATAGGDRQWR